MWQQNNGELDGALAAVVAVAGVGGAWPRVSAGLLEWAVSERFVQGRLHECVLQIYSTGLENFSGPAGDVSDVFPPVLFLCPGLGGSQREQDTWRLLTPDTSILWSFEHHNSSLWYLAAEIRFICSCELLALTATRGLGEIRPQY